MKKNSLIKLRNSLQVACSVIGRSPETVAISGNNILIDDVGVLVSPSLSNGKRTWRAFHSFRAVSLDEKEERQVSIILFEEPFGSEISMAKRVAMYVAEKAVELALDSSLS